MDIKRTLVITMLACAGAGGLAGCDKMPAPCSAEEAEQMLASSAPPGVGACAMPPALDRLLTLARPRLPDQAQSHALVDQALRLRPYYEHCGGDEFILSLDQTDDDEALEEMIKSGCGIDESWGYDPNHASNFIAVGAAKGWALHIGPDWPQELQKRAVIWSLGR